MSLKGKCCHGQKFVPARGRAQIDRKIKNLPSSFARASGIGDKPALRPARSYLHAGQIPLSDIVDRSMGAQQDYGRLAADGDKLAMTAMPSDTAPAIETIARPG
jgi:hypothetical protein